MNDFKIGDTIKPKSDRAQALFRTLSGKIIDFLGAGDTKFPVIKNQDGDLLTVNPDIYEKVEDKENRT